MILFSLPVHEKQDIINNQIENILNYNPNSKIMLHINKSFKTFIPENTTSIYKNVYINSMSFNYIHGKGLLWIHINNYLEALRLNLDFKYIVIISSNEMFIRNGLIDYIEKYKNGLQLVENSPNVVWHLFKKDIDKIDSITNMLSELNLNNIYGGQTEGQFYEKHVFDYISNIYIKYFGNTELSTFETEEIIPQTIFKSLNLPYGLPITLQNYCTNIIFTEDIINNIIDNKYIVPNVQIGANLFSPHINNDSSSIFSIKRIDRTFNNLRKYLSKNGFILNKDIYKNNYKSNIEYYSNGSILKINNEYNTILFKKYKTNTTKEYNWFGYELEKGYYVLSFQIKTNKQITSNHSIKIHFPTEILYKSLFDNLIVDKWTYIELPVHLHSKQLLLFMFDNYLDDLDIEIKNIDFNQKCMYKYINNKPNILISLYQNKIDENNNTLNNNTVNYNNIYVNIIKPLEETYNVYISISVCNLNKISDLIDLYRPIIITHTNNINLISDNINDIMTFSKTMDIQFKSIFYIKIDTIFNFSIEKLYNQIDICKINFLSYQIPYINHQITNSFNFTIIPYEYINIFKNIIDHNINNDNILNLLYTYTKYKYKHITDTDKYNFIYNNIYEYNGISNPSFINYITDIENLNNNLGYLLDNKYYNNIIYTNNNTIFYLNNHEYYFYKNKTTKSTSYMWIGRYINYLNNTNINNKINICVEFYIKLLKHININNNNTSTDNILYGLKTHEPKEYYTNWINECNMNIGSYMQIKINMEIYPKSQYIILNFDNYLDEVEFYIKDFSIKK